MNPFVGTAFGAGIPSAYPVSQNPWGVSPYTFLGSGQLSPFAAGGIGGQFGLGAPIQQPLQQIAQLLQIVPQQLQQLYALQQQQLQYLHQLLQQVPAQLQQLHQLIQFVPYQIQQLQHTQPFGAGIGGPVGFGLVPSQFAGQASGPVM